MANMNSSHVWQIVEDWLEVVPFPPSQSKIAEHLGVSRSAVSDWKSGKTRPSPANLRALAQMMQPQMGPGVKQRLSMALLADMGYDPVDETTTGASSIRRLPTLGSVRPNLSAFDDEDDEDAAAARNEDAEKPKLSDDL